jgi:hypothetical protein
VTNYAITLVGARREQRLGVYDAEEAAIVLSEFCGGDVDYVRDTYVTTLEKVPLTWTDQQGRERPNRRAMSYAGGLEGYLEIAIEIDKGGTT